MLSQISALIFTLLLSLAAAQAGSSKLAYTKIDIPGAKCGDGLQYHVFLHQDSMHDDKFLAYLESGGACWSWDTCWGPNFRAWVHPLPFPRIKLSKFKKRDVFKGYSSIIFPYCTGDIFGADFVSSYKIHHVGKKNIQLTFDYLIAQNFINPQQYRSLVVSGSSAGAIGALINANKVHSYFTNASEKTLIMDSPGMHWGDKFWNKFSPEMLQQFEQSTSHILGDLTSHGGLVIKHLNKLCQHFYDWNVGILQSTKDVIMSGVFGNISPKKHKQIVYGPNGVYQQSLGINNCAAWSPDSYGHAFLQLDPLQSVEAGTVSSFEFVHQILEGDTFNSYKD